MAPAAGWKRDRAPPHREVGARRVPNGGVQEERLEQHSLKVFGRDAGMAEPPDEAARKRVLKTSGVKDASIERRQRRLAHSLLCCFSSQFAPNRLIRSVHFEICRLARERIAAQRRKIGSHRDLAEGHLQKAFAEILARLRSLRMIFLNNS